MDMSDETYQATASIQLRTHPTHTSVHFSDLGKKLLESARNGESEEVSELINSGAPFTTDWLGASPIHYAAQFGHIETVERLLKAGIAKDSRTKIERTPLHVASQEGYLDIVMVLVNYGCDVDAVDMLRMTPLHWAVQRRHTEISEFLLSNGADVMMINKFDRTPIDIAYSVGLTEFVPVLMSYKGKAKPKVNPIENALPVRIKNHSGKNRSKSQTPNRAGIIKMPMIKQEIIDDDVNINDQEMNQSANGPTFRYKTPETSGKIILNAFNFNKDQQNTSNNSNANNNNTQMKQKIFSMNSMNPLQGSNFVLLSNTTTSSKNDILQTSNGPIKVMTTSTNNKKQSFNNSNSKTFQVDKFPFFNSKQNSPVNINNIKRIVINPNQNINTLQSKDEEIRKLQDEIQKLKSELEEYKSLIISKDLEIERLKRRRDFENE